MFQFNGGSLLIWLNDTSFLIPFSGTQVEVYGTIGPTGDALPMSTYLLDSTSILTYVAANVSATTYQNQFYLSPVLQDGSHTLVITVTSQGFYWLDYLLYTPSSNNLASAPISSSSSLSSSSSISSALSATSSAGSAASSTSSCPHANGSQSSSIPVGAIAGGVVGGFILGALLIAGLLYCWKRNPTGTSKENRGALALSPGKSLYPIDNFVRTSKNNLFAEFRTLSADAQIMSPFPHPYSPEVYPSATSGFTSAQYSQPSNPNNAPFTHDRGSSYPSSSSRPEAVSNMPPAGSIFTETSYNGSSTQSYARPNQSRDQGVELQRRYDQKGLPPVYQRE
ncbi:hypothetical protein PHLCEN_2v13113 [Hermanssonia centrifuga]|uniref:Uncharacterized protein n=1 Tax=Hermanssonia centrifuga TaxID=98765 RepID=A0A2R6NFE7_9APHY|nr:hypothetical protein PHLCEN_2v13113 [Hermanssonia centrifuga]